MSKLDLGKAAAEPCSVDDMYLYQNWKDFVEKAVSAEVTLGIS